ncbi:MAG: DnaJ C-terminal domain-containing protein, partial [Candidatus Adiutrix sp.]
TCQGGGAILRPQSLKVRIASGINTGQMVRLKGKGAPGTNGGPSGDLLVEITVKPHEVFTRKGRDLYADVPVGLYDALLGGTVKVPTLTGQASLKIPAGSQSGNKMRLKGKGLSPSAKLEAGDLYVTLKIILPTNLSDEAKLLVQQLAQKAPLGDE